MHSSSHQIIFISCVRVCVSVSVCVSTVIVLFGNMNHNDAQRMVELEYRDRCQSLQTRVEHLQTQVLMLEGLTSFNEMNIMIVMICIQ